MACWLGLSDVEVTPRGDLASRSGQRLIPALVGRATAASSLAASNPRIELVPEAMVATRSPAAAEAHQRLAYDGGRAGRTAWRLGP